jgi:hypothetical protein
MTYYVFDEPALNTFSEREAMKKAAGPYRIVDEIEVPVLTLKQILDRNLPEGAAIDFMTIDTEGLDSEVVASNDWGRYRPSVVLVELLDTELDGLSENPTAQLLGKVGYQVFAKTCNTFFFMTAEMANRWHGRAE